MKYKYNNFNHSILSHNFIERYAVFWIRTKLKQKQKLNKQNKNKNKTKQISSFIELYVLNWFFFTSIRNIYGSFSSHLIFLQLFVCCRFCASRTHLYYKSMYYVTDFLHPSVLDRVLAEYLHPYASLLGWYFQLYVWNWSFRIYTQYTCIGLIFFIQTQIFTVN